MKNKATMSSKNLSPSKRDNNNTFTCVKCLNPKSHKAHHPECEHSQFFKKAKLSTDASKMKILKHFTSARVGKSLSPSTLSAGACENTNRRSTPSIPSQGPAAHSNSLSKVKNPYKKKLLSPMPPMQQSTIVSQPSKSQVVLKPPPPLKPKPSFMPPFRSPSVMDVSE